MKFELKEDERIIINPAYLLIPELLHLWKSDTTKEKVVANKELKFIFLVCHVDSPLKNKPIDKRKDDAYRMIGQKFDLSDAGETAYKAMMYLRETSEYYLIDDINDKIEDMRKVYKNTTITIDNAKNAKDILVYINDMIEERDKLKKRIEQKALKVSVRGGYEPTPLSKGEINVEKMMSDKKKNKKKGVSDAS